MAHASALTPWTRRFRFPCQNPFPFSVRPVWASDARWPHFLGSCLDFLRGAGYNTVIARSVWVLRGLLHLALVGVDARGFPHARQKRRVVVSFVYWPYRSAWVALNALLSKRQLMTGFQVIL